MNPTLLALYGLKWNPFSPELPTEALYVPAKVENFCWRIEQAMIREGGLLLISRSPSVEWKTDSVLSVAQTCAVLTLSRA